MNTIERHGPPGSEMGDAVELPTRLEPPRGSGRIDLAFLLQAFRSRLRLFLFTIAATVALVVIFCIVYPPQFTATARVTINQRTLTPAPRNDSPVVSQLPVLSGDVDTEVQVIQSRRVAARVVQGLHLDRDPEFNGTKPGIKQALTSMFLSVLHPIKSSGTQDTVIDAVLGNLNAQRYLDTNAIDINFIDQDSGKAMRIANAFANAYLADQVSVKLGQGNGVTNDLLAHVEAMRVQAQSDSDKVQAYKIAHNLMSVGAQTLTEQEISTYNQQIAAAKAQAAGDEADLRTAKEQLAAGSNGEDVGQALSSPVVGALRAQRATLSAKLADLEGHYGPKYPDLAQARRELADLDQEIAAEIRRTISNLAAKADISQKRLASLEATLGTTKATLAENNAAQAGLDDLSRAATVSEAIYEAYLNRFKQAAAQLSDQVPDADIVSTAERPTNPSFPVITLFLPLGLVAGILFGCAAVLIAEMLETRMATAEDVEQKLGCAYMGGVPLLSSVHKGGGLSTIDAIVKEPASVFSEAYRGLLASLELATPDSRAMMVLITSAQPREGKTTTTVNLARTSALRGVPTICIDCDVHRRGLTRALRVAQCDAGVMEVLAGKASLDEVMMVDEASGAFFLPMASGQSRSDELLGQDAMADLLAKLRARFQVVLLDAPPLPISVTRMIAAKVDSTLLVVGWRSTNATALRSAIRLPPFDQVPPIGVVLNSINMSQQAKYGYGTPGYFYSKYKHYYG
jgi:uncharacterized protein involved in exopolysaccharide biosynthesis/Mrp family chromosome partitioning ATPase